jgi:hypothetical protein
MEPTSLPHSGHGRTIAAGRYRTLRVYAAGNRPSLTGFETN